MADGTSDALTVDDQWLLDDIPILISRGSLRRGNGSPWISIDCAWEAIVVVKNRDWTYGVWTRDTRVVRIDTVVRDFRERVSDQVRLAQDGVEQYRVFTPFLFEDGDHLRVRVEEIQGMPERARHDEVSGRVRIVLDEC